LVLFCHLKISWQTTPHFVFHAPFVLDVDSRTYIKGFDREWMASEISSFRKGHSDSPLDSHSLWCYWSNRTYLMLIPLPILCPPLQPLWQAKYGFLSGQHTSSPLSLLWDFGHRAGKCITSAPSKLHIPSLQIGRMASSSWSKPTNRSVSPTMSVDHATTAATCCMVNISAPSALMPTCSNCVHQDWFGQILYKVITPYISSTWQQALFNANITQNTLILYTTFFQIPYWQSTSYWLHLHS